MKAGGGRGPWVVLTVVSAAALSAVAYVHYDQQRQREVRNERPGVQIQDGSLAQGPPNLALGSMLASQEMRRAMLIEKARDREERTREAD
jgi:hypothetical protein